jgi:hypothetical protein
MYNFNPRFQVGKALYAGAGPSYLVPLATEATGPAAQPELIKAKARHRAGLDMAPLFVAKERLARGGLPNIETVFFANPGGNDAALTRLMRLDAKSTVD